MADIGQVLATGGTTIVAVGVGAGLTYWLGALNRRHQEEREDATRWYDARHQAYVELYQAAHDAYFTAYGTTAPQEVRGRLAQRLLDAVGAIHFVGSPEVIEAAEKVLDGGLEELRSDAEMRGDFLDKLDQFQVAARKDLGHPSPERVEDGEVH